MDRQSTNRSSVIDVTWRALLIVAYQMIQAWWFFSRPDVRGSHVILRRASSDPASDDDWEYLVVRNSYRRGLGFVCGRAKPNESPVDCAQRELSEEVNLHLPTNRFQPLFDSVLQYGWCRDHAHFFTLTIEAEEADDIVIDNREVISAEFLAPDSLRGLDLLPHLRRFLDRYPDPSARRV
jgi:8-oxo-dGTP pyrophosphatase MutT (NUDIX family)